jgi:hypothetical protein
MAVSTRPAMNGPREWVKGIQADPARNRASDEHSASPEDVAEAPHERHHGHVCDQVGVHDPRRAVEAVGQRNPQIADDLAQHGGDDREVVGSYEHAEADRGQDGSR